MLFDPSVQPFFWPGEARKQYEVGVPHMPNALNSLTNENTSHLQFQAATIPNIEKAKSWVTLHASNM
jgi:hypothetical protein